MNNPETSCSICDSPAVNSEHTPCGALVSSPLYSGQAYKVVLCAGCFGSCFANLRRDRLVHTMFSDIDESLDDWGRVSARYLSHENEAALELLLDTLTRDIEASPELLVPVTKELVARIQALIERCDVDLNAPVPHDQ